MSSHLPVLPLATRARGMHSHDALARRLWLLVAIGFGALALAADVPWLMGMAGLLTGYAFRPEADRYYLEGFGDGLEAGASLAADGRGPAGLASRGGGLSPDVAGPAPGGAGEDQRQPRGARAFVSVEQPRPAPDVPRPARPAVTADGRPLSAIGPRPATFRDPSIDLGTRSLDPLRPKRTEARRQDGQGSGHRTVKKGG